MKYRKKPVVIDAVLYDGNVVGEPDGNGGVVPLTRPEWLPAIVCDTHPDNKVRLKAGEVAYCGDDFCIGTLEGVHVASPGDYIIRGIKGEIYPCKPDIFAATYAPEQDQ